MYLLIKFSAPAPSLCCRITSSFVMMQSPSPGRQARAEGVEGRSPLIIFQLLQVAARLYIGAQCHKCIRGFKDMQSFKCCCAWSHTHIGCYIFYSLACNRDWFCFWLFCFILSCSSEFNLPIIHLFCAAFDMLYAWNYLENMPCVCAFVLIQGTCV